MQDLSFTNLKPPIITIGNTSISDVVFIVQSSELTKSEVVVLNGVMKAGEQADSSYINAAIVAKEINKSEQTVRAMLKRLTEKNIFIEESCKTHPTIVRAASLFSFNPNLKTESLVDLISTSQKDLVNLSYGITDEYGLADNVICKYLFAVLLYNHKSRLSQNDGIVYVNGNPIHVKASSMSGTRLAQIKDLRYYLALLNICERQMESRIFAYRQGRMAEADLKSTLFTIFEVDILSTLGVGTGSSERANMKAAINRLDVTGYELLNPSMGNLNDLGIKERNIKIRHFDVIDYIKGKDNKIQYTLEFPQNIIDLMFIQITDNLDIFKKADPRIFNENNAMRLAFMFWITHQSTGKVLKESWQSLKDAIAPSKSMFEFKIDMSKFLSKYALEDEEVGEKFLTYTKNKEIVESCKCSFNDVNITLTIEDGFYISKKITTKVIKEGMKKTRKLLLDPLKTKNNNN